MVGHLPSFFVLTLAHSNDSDEFAIFFFLKKANAMELAWTAAQCVCWIMITTCNTNLVSVRLVIGGVFIFISF